MDEESLKIRLELFGAARWLQDSIYTSHSRGFKLRCRCRLNPSR